MQCPLFYNVKHKVQKIIQVLRKLNAREYLFSLGVWVRSRKMFVKLIFSIVQLCRVMHDIVNLDSCIATFSTMSFSDWKGSVHLWYWVVSFWSCICFHDRLGHRSREEPARCGSLWRGACDARSIQVNRLQPGQS